MKTLEWLFKHSLKTAKILAVIFVMVFIMMLIMPSGYIKWLMNKIALSDVVLPAPRQVPVATMDQTEYPEDYLERTDFARLIQTINLRPGDTIAMDSIVYGYARSDLFDKETGTMHVVVRKRDGMPVATAQAYTQYYNGGYGFIPFSVRIPYLLTAGGCLLEFRKEPLTAHVLNDILFTSMPVTCQVTTR